MYNCIYIYIYLYVGPLLFLIYINATVNSNNVLSFVLFADDTTVYVQNDSIDSDPCLH